MSWALFKISIYEKWKKYWYDTHPFEIADYSWNFLFTGGKEIRSTLFYELWRYLSPDTVVCGELAFAMECIHVASLILDDTPWMDNADERRGKCTLHRVFSPKKAILLCHDVMYMVYLIWQENKPPHIELYAWQEFMKNKLQRLMIGQWYDLNKQGTLVELASLKTGILFEFVTETVALCIDLDANFWKIWGNNLGILFQWTDDWKDRDEDILQKNRNAFNEDYDTTLQNYMYLWKKIEIGIGRGWFERPYGQFMKSYFTQTIQDKIDNTVSYHLHDIYVPYPMNLITSDILENKIEKRHIFKIINGNDILKKMFILSDHLYKKYDVYLHNYINQYCSLKSILWSIHEDEWSKHSELKRILHDIIEDILDEVEANNVPNLYEHEIARIARDALQELEEFEETDDTPKLYLSDMKEIIVEAIEQIEDRDILPEVQSIMNQVVDEIRTRETKKDK